MSYGIESSRRFYENHVAGMIHERFGRYEDRIAVGLSGEGSDCFGYDDLVSRDHDFGTGVCLWLTDGDMREFGAELAAAYEELADAQPGNDLSARLRERRGVMTIHDFYSGILNIDCDTDNCSLSSDDWQRLDHNCLATAVNGEVFRDDAGYFSAFRRLLLDYYPDRIWKIRIVDELHRFAASLQVNYARCMTRGDLVAARLCHMNGLEAAMQLFFLMKRVYPPYYKWTYRRLAELDENGMFTELTGKLAAAGCDLSCWENVPYRPDIPNFADDIVVIAERLAESILSMLCEKGLTTGADPYLERYVDEILKTI